MAPKDELIAQLLEFLAERGHSTARSGLSWPVQSQQEGQAICLPSPILPYLLEHIIVQVEHCRILS